MKVTLLTVVFVAVGSLPALAQEKVFGEVSLSYGLLDDDKSSPKISSLTGQIGGAFVSAAGFGVQLGGAFTKASVEDGGDLNIGSFDGHVYADAKTFKVGAFVAVMDLGDLNVYDLGAIDLDTKITSYGLEGQSKIGSLNLSAFAGLADIEDVDEVDIAIYGVGVDYAANDLFSISADFDGLTIWPDGYKDITSGRVSLGADYYLAVQNAPLKLSASIGRTSVDFDGEKRVQIDYGIGAAFLFGGEKGSSREALFESAKIRF
jgi:hypothetical protein